MWWGFIPSPFAGMNGALCFVDRVGGLAEGGAALAAGSLARWGPGCEWMAGCALTRNQSRQSGVAQRGQPGRVPGRCLFC